MFALKTLHEQRLSSLALLALPLLFGGLMAGCSKEPVKTVDIRPVRVVVLQSSHIAVDAAFSGEVRARIESRLGFRVGGKIVARKVDVGSAVKREQVLMQLDAQDLQLSQAQAQAVLRAAETQRDLAKVELKRYQDLKEKNFVSQTVLDSKDSAFKSAQANVDSAQAALRGQANQSGYSILVADIDGVVTAVDAEAGQVVAAGTPVVRVAGAGQKEVVIGLPEDQVASLRQVSNVRVKLWAKAQTTVPGKIREISPMADPATRTYTAKISIPDSMTDAQLGMTAVVQFSSSTATPQIKLPLTALFQDKGATSVWVVEQGTVRLAPVTISGAAGNELIVGSGLQDGQTVVTAGVNLLKPGQKVTILGADLALKAEPAPAQPGANVDAANAASSKAGAGAVQ